MVANSVLLTQEALDGLKQHRHINSVMSNQETQFGLQVIILPPK